MSLSKRLLPAILVILLMIASAAYGTAQMLNATNPDPNHTHADFAIWINGTKLDLSDAKYMSGSSTDSGSHPTEGLRKYLHLHDNITWVVHEHKPGLTFGDFLESLGFLIQWQKNGDPQISCLLTPEGNSYCDEMKNPWQFYVNGERIGGSKHSSGKVAEHWYMWDLEAAKKYAFHDGDHLLLTYGADDAEVQKELSQMTNDACLYSQTCPWRGKPPVENCIADPEVPCTL